jgi:ribosomal-protein-alanine acetyltransferase
LISEKINNNEIVFRELAECDLVKVHTLEEKIFPDPWSYEAFQEQLSGSGWGGIIAEIGSEIIGYACYFIAAHEAHITNLAVAQEYRRKSVAKQLLDNILLIVSKYECEFILLEVRSSNIEAIDFYKKHGFTFLYQRPDYYRKPVEDAYVFVRYFE